MQVELWNIADVTPYAANPRRNDHAVEAVARSIATFGFRQPIVVDEQKVIIVGETRYKAGVQLGLKQVPVHVARGLTPAQAKAYRLADNKSAELADWDTARLVQELADLQKLDFAVDMLGFSADELQALLAGDVATGLEDADAVPEAPEQPVTRAHDLWLLGGHRLLCADAAQARDVDRLLAGAAIHLVNTDPPYNVGVEPRSRSAMAAGRSSFQPGHARPPGVPRRASKAAPRQLCAKDRPLVNDFVSETDFDRLLGAWCSNFARALLPGRVYFMWGGYSNIGNYPHALKASGLYFSQQIIWVKEHPVLTRKDFLGNHEWCFYGWREGAAHQFFGPANVTDVWAVKKVTPQAMVHLTEKPVELAVRALQYGSRPGEHVLDLFGGSGSTLIAATRRTAT